MDGRSERIRTSGLCVPNAALYQAELHSDSGPGVIAPTSGHRQGRSQSWRRRLGRSVLSLDRVSGAVTSSGRRGHNRTKDSAPATRPCLRRSSASLMPSRAASSTVHCSLPRRAKLNTALRSRKDPRAELVRVTSKSVFPNPNGREPPASPTAAFRAHFRRQGKQGGTGQYARSMQKSTTSIRARFSAPSGNIPSASRAIAP